MDEINPEYLLRNLKKLFLELKQSNFSEIEFKIF
jgi:hypothetical protein